MLIADGDLQAAQDVLRRFSSQRDTAADYATFVAIRRGDQLDPQQEINGLPANLPDQRRLQLATLFYRAQGDLARAADFASQLTDDYVAPVRSLLIQTGRFPAVSALAGKSGYKNDPLLVAHLLGQDDLVQQIILDADDQRDPAFSALNKYLLADRAQDAIQVSKTRADSRHVAFHLLCQQLRIREALATIADGETATPDMCSHLSDLGLQSQARKLLAGAQSYAIHADSSISYSVAFSYAAELDHAGAHQEAADYRAHIFDLMDALKVTTIDDQIHKLQQTEAEVEALAAQMLAGTDAPVDQINMRLEMIHAKIGDAQQQRTGLSHILGSATFRYDPHLPGDAWRDALWWNQTVLWARPTPAAQRYNEAIRIVTGSLSDDEVSLLLRECSPAQFSGHTPAHCVALASHWTTALHRTKRDADAENLVQQLVERDHDPIYFSLLGDLALEKGDSEAAAKYYRQAAVSNPVDATLMYRFGLALSRLPQTAAAGKHFMATAPLLVLGDHLKIDDLADTIRRLEGENRANQWLDNYLSHYTIGADAFDARVVARAQTAALSKADYSLALKLQTQVLFNPYTTTDFSPVMANMALYHKCRALDALSRKDFPTLESALTGTLNNGPPDIDLLEKTLPTLRTANPAAATQILTRAIDRLTPVVQDYPEATPYKSQLTRLQKLQQNP